MTFFLFRLKDKRQSLRTLFDLSWQISYNGNLHIQHDDANVFREIDSWCQTVWHRRFLSSNLVAINSIKCDIREGSHRHDKGELNAHSVGHQTLQRWQ